MSAHVHSTNPSIASAYLHELFEQQAKLLPSQLAVIYENEEISYQQLEQRANQLAHRLQRLSIGANNYVGILVERNDFAYVAMLAILKIGAAYVPLNPDYPTERINYILKDSGASLLITTSHLLLQHETLDGEHLALDQELENLSTEATSPLNSTSSNLSPDDICYVIYTSGSTGKPKGVAIKHRSVCNYIMGATQVYGLGPGDRSYQGFSLAFDASVEEIWITLTSGATLIPTNDKALRAGAGLPEFLNKHRVSFFSTTPTLLSMLEPPIPSLRLIVLGGEVLPQDVVSRWSKPGLRIINTYGPTEAAVVTTYSECHPDTPITIGRPLPNCEVYILDEQMQAVGEEQEGEIYIGGVCLARGYINRPDLNEKKFIHHPELSNKRLYRTGDLGYRLANGEIQFTGRSDNQIKLRGFRIELTEIEAVIMQYPGVLNAIVSTWEQSPGVQSLVAYLTPESQHDFNLDALPDFLRSRLAHYMVPSFFELIDKFPLTTNGKIDRQGLPAPKVNTLSSKENHIDARTETERKITAIWEKLFNRSSVSMNADFFYELGGHSLLAAKAVSLLRTVPGLEHTSIVDIYQHPTIEKLAIQLQQNHSQEQASNLPHEDIIEVQPSKSTCQYYASCCVQFIGCFLQFAIHSWEYLFAILLLTYVINKYSFYSLQTVGTFAALIFIVPPLLFAFTISMKWLLLGRVRPGNYPLWSGFYLRWWFVQRIHKTLTPIIHLSGSPLINLYCRLMGAKIGKNCHLATFRIGTFDLLTIGDDSSISHEAALPGYIVENGFLKIGTITIGERCFVGARSVLGINTKMEDDAMMEDLSMLPNHSTIPKGQHYHGSPARPVAIKKDYKSVHNISEQGSGWSNFGFGLLHYFGLLLVATIYYTAFIPGIILVSYFYQTQGILSSILIAAPLASIGFIASIWILLIITKKTLLKNIQPGCYKLKSGFYVRKWIVARLLDIPELEVLAESLYFPYFMRSLGAKIGQRVEIAELIHVTPELFSIHDESFTTGGVMVGTPRPHLGYVTYAPTIIGKRTFVGSSAVLPPGTELGNHCLIGCLSIPPANGDARKFNSAWLGSPPMFLPKREVNTHFSEKETFSPGKLLYTVRAVIEFFRIILPTTFYFIILIGLFLSIDFLSGHYSLSGLLLLFPIFDIGILLIMAGLAIALKWLLMGRYRPDVKPLWNIFIWKSDLLERLHNVFLGRLIFEPLLGTPFMAFMLRLLGAKIGKRSFIDTSRGFAEYDLIELGDNVALNLDSVMLTHLFEDRIFKMDRIKVDDGCCVGVLSEIIYSAEMEKNSTLGNLSLLMKGERLPANSHWEGIPSQNIREHHHVAVTDNASINVSESESPEELG